MRPPAVERAPITRGIELDQFPRNHLGEVFNIAKKGPIITGNSEITFVQTFAEDNLPGEVRISFYTDRALQWEATIDRNQELRKFRPGYAKAADGTLSAEYITEGLPLPVDPEFAPAGAEQPEFTSDEGKRLWKRYRANVIVDVVKSYAEMRFSGFAVENGEAITVKSRGRVLRVGDRINSIEAQTSFGPHRTNLLEGTKGVKVISVVNKQLTDICRLQTDRMEKIAAEPRGITFFSLSKESIWELREAVMKQGIKFQELATIDDTVATLLGVALEPEEGGNSYWNDMLLRTVIVLDANNSITYIQHVVDQMQEPDYEALQAALAA